MSAMMDRLQRNETPTALFPNDLQLCHTKLSPPTSPISPSKIAEEAKRECVESSTSSRADYRETNAAGCFPSERITRTETDRTFSTDLDNRSISTTYSANSLVAHVNLETDSTSAIRDPSLAATYVQDTSSDRRIRTFGSEGNQGSLTTCTSLNGVTVEIDSSQIERRSRKLYVGRMKELPPPPFLLSKWLEVRKRLVKDLVLVIQQLPARLSSQETMFEPELCMAGYVKGRRIKTIDLKPTVWLSCGSKECKRAIRKAVADLNYVRNFSEGRIEVRTGGPHLAATGLDTVQEEVDITGPSLCISDGYALHLHYQETLTQSSACGLKLLVTVSKEGTIVRQHMSTIGGLVCMDDKVYGITTAHAILGDPTPPSNSLDDASESELESDLDSDSAYSCSDTEGHEKERSVSWQHGRWRQQIPRSSNTIPPRLSWNRLRNIGHVCFNDKEIVNGSVESSRISESSADFALLDLGLCTKFVLHNTYWPPGSTTKVIVNSEIDDESLIEGPVSILASQDQVIQGYLLAGTSTYVTREAVYCTRKIQLEQPLGQGTSGTWVVRDTMLCGIVVAVYDASPYAHMTTVETLFSDIKRMEGKKFIKNTILRIALETDCQGSLESGMDVNPSPMSGRLCRNQAETLPHGFEKPLSTYRHPPMLSLPFSPGHRKQSNMLSKHVYDDPGVEKRLAFGNSRARLERLEEEMEKIEESLKQRRKKPAAASAASATSSSGNIGQSSPNG